MTELPPTARVVVEGAFARFCGRPFDECPYDSVHGERQYEAWRWSWRYADYLFERAGAEEAARWLQEEEAA